MVYLKKAAEEAPEIAQYSYVYGIGLNSLGNPQEALVFLTDALEQHPYNRDILYALTTINMEQDKLKEAREYALKLTEYYPEDQNYKQVLEYLGR
jgi:tetratricopeptide (TPR) repeat protein